MFSTTTAMADPGSGLLRFNNADQQNTTAIAIDVENAYAVNVAAWLNSFDDSTNDNKGYLSIYGSDDGSTFDGQEFFVFEVTGLTANIGWTELAVTNTVYNTDLSALDTI